MSSSTKSTVLLSLRRLDVSSETRKPRDGFGRLSIPAMANRVPSDPVMYKLSTAGASGSEAPNLPMTVDLSCMLTSLGFPSLPPPKPPNPSELVSASPSSTSKLHHHRDLAAHHHYRRVLPSTLHPWPRSHGEISCFIISATELHSDLNPSHLSWHWSSCSPGSPTTKLLLRHSDLNPSHLSWRWSSGSPDSPTTKLLLRALYPPPTDAGLLSQYPSKPKQDLNPRHPIEWRWSQSRLNIPMTGLLLFRYVGGAFISFVLLGRNEENYLVDLVWDLCLEGLVHSCFFYLVDLLLRLNLSYCVTSAIFWYLGGECKSRNLVFSVTRSKARGAFKEGKRTFSVKSESLQLARVIYFGSIVSKHHGLLHDLSSFSTRFEFIRFSFILAWHAFVTEF
ncbi:unnamed protein product [Arabis nemorensis]|uniref:Uncharacterized protein n=1 Tax=Arabis nemorensis TaxID=586526 RepID=A0A565CBW9_9BRAS|nr:unnamed protein product [Arabis nemorensis]